MSPAVWALNALTNSMMLMPCWPRAGPTGGAGVACPPGACSLMVVRTFFISAFDCQGSRDLPEPGAAAPEIRSRPPSATSDLLHLIVANLHRRLPAEDRHEDLEL